MLLSLTSNFLKYRTVSIGYGSSTHTASCFRPFNVRVCCTILKILGQSSCSCKDSLWTKVVDQLPSASVATLRTWLKLYSHCIFAGTISNICIFYFLFLQRRCYKSSGVFCSIAIYSFHPQAPVFLLSDPAVEAARRSKRLRTPHWLILLEAGKYVQNIPMETFTPELLRPHCGYVVDIFLWWRRRSCIFTYWQVSVWNGCFLCCSLSGRSAGFSYSCSACTTHDNKRGGGGGRDVRHSGGWLKALTLMYGFSSCHDGRKENVMATTNEIILPYRTCASKMTVTYAKLHKPRRVISSYRNKKP